MLSPDDNLTFDSIDLGLWGENGSTGLQQRVEFLQEELTKKNKDFYDIKNKILMTDQLIVGMSTSEKEFKTILKKLQESNMTCDRYKSDCEMYSEKLRSSLSELEPLKKEKEYYEREFRSQQTKFEKMKTEIDVYKEFMRQSKAASEMMEEKYKKLETEHKLLTLNHKKMEKKLARCQEEIIEKKQEFIRVKKENTALRNNVLNLEMKLTSLKSIPPKSSSVARSSGKTVIEKPSVITTATTSRGECFEDILSYLRFMPVLSPLPQTPSRSPDAFLSDTESLPESNTVDDGFEDFASQLEKEPLPTFLSPIRDRKKEKGDSASPLETKLVPTFLSPIRDRKEDEDDFASRLEQELLPPFLSPIRDQKKKNNKTCKKKSDVQQTHSGSDTNASSQMAAFSDIKERVDSCLSLSNLAVREPVEPSQSLSSKNMDVTEPVEHSQSLSSKIMDVTKPVDSSHSVSTSNMDVREPVEVDSPNKIISFESPSTGETVCKISDVNSKSVKKVPRSKKLSPKPRTSSRYNTRLSSARSASIDAADVSQSMTSDTISPAPSSASTSADVGPSSFTSADVGPSSAPTSADVVPSSVSTSVDVVPSSAPTSANVAPSSASTSADVGPSSASTPAADVGPSSASISADVGPSSASTSADVAPSSASASIVSISTPSTSSTDISTFPPSVVAPSTAPLSFASTSFDVASSSSPVAPRTHPIESALDPHPLISSLKPVSSNSSAVADKNCEAAGNNSSVNDSVAVVPAVDDNPSPVAVEEVETDSQPIVDDSLTVAAIQTSEFDRFSKDINSVNRGGDGCAMKYSGATIGSKYLGSDMSVDMIMKEVELLRPLSPLMDVAVHVAGKKERKRKIKTEESSTSKKEKKKAKKENNRANDGNQADVASGSGDAQPSNSSHSFNTALFVELQCAVKFRSRAISDFAKKFATHSIDQSDLVDTFVKTFLTFDVDMAETWLHRCESGESPDDAPWLTASQSRLLEIFSECCMIQKFNDLEENFLTSAINRLLSSDEKQLPACISSLCCAVTSICRKKGDVERVRTLLYNALRHRCNFIPTLLVTIGATWPQSISSASPENFSPVLSSIQYVVFEKEINSIVKQRKVRIMLEKLCGWQAPGEGVDQIVQNIVDRMRTLLAENNKNEDVCWDAQMALELLCAVEGWQWTNNHVAGQVLWPILAEWATSPASVSQTFVETVIILLGSVMSQCPSNLYSSTDEILDSLTALLHEDSVDFSIRQASLHSIVALAKFQPDRCFQTVSQFAEMNSANLDEPTRQLLDMFSRTHRPKLIL